MHEKGRRHFNQWCKPKVNASYFRHAIEKRSSTNLKVFATVVPWPILSKQPKHQFSDQCLIGLRFNDDLNVTKIRWLYMKARKLCPPAFKSDTGVWLENYWSVSGEQCVFFKDTNLNFAFCIVNVLSVRSHYALQMANSVYSWKVPHATDCWKKPIGWMNPTKWCLYTYCVSREII